MIQAQALKKMTTFCLLFLMMTLFQSCGFFSNSQQSRRDTLVVGINPWSPYVIVNDQGELEGFDIEVARALGQSMGKQIEFKNIPFESMIIELMQGKVDMIIGGVSITKERLAKIAMVHYTGAGKTSLPLVFWKNIPEGVQTVEDIKNLPNKIVCVQPGSLQENLFSRFGFLELRLIDSVSDMVMDIKYGKSLAFALEHQVVAAMVKKHQELKVLTVPLSEDLQDQGIGIGLNRKNGTLVLEIKKLIDVYKSDGTLEKLEQKWFKEGE